MNAMLEYSEDAKIGMKVRYRKECNNNFHKRLGNGISPYNVGKKEAINEQDVLTIVQVTKNLWFTELKFKEIPNWSYNMYMFEEVTEEISEKQPLLRKLKGLFKRLVS